MIHETMACQHNINDFALVAGIRLLQRPAMRPIATTIYARQRCVETLFTNLGSLAPFKGFVHRSAHT